MIGESITRGASWLGGQPERPALVDRVELVAAEYRRSAVDDVSDRVDGVGLKYAHAPVPSSLGTTIGSSVPFGRFNCPLQNARGSETE